MKRATKPHLITGFQSHYNADECQKRKYPRRTAGTITKKNKENMKKIQKWMKNENKMFSTIGGEKFTNCDVLYTHAGLLLFLAAIGVVGALVQ